jgi:hypothetical protein
MEIHFTDAATASLPHSQLSQMSKTQLMQSITVLQAGWSAAVKKLNDVMRNRESFDGETRDEIAVLRAELMAKESAEVDNETQRRRALQRVEELETELAQYRRAMRDEPSSFVVGKLKDDLIQTRGRLLEVERLLRQREPLNLQFLKIRVDELLRQREQDKRRIVEDALTIGRLKQQLSDAAEQNALTASPPRPASPVGPTPGGSRSSRWDFALSAATYSSAKTKRFGETDAELRAPEMKDASAQATLGVLKAIDLLHDKNKQIDECIAAKDAAEMRCEALSVELANLKETLSVVEASEKRKEELLMRLVSTPINQSTTESMENMIKREDERSQLLERVRKLESALTTSDDRARSAEERAVQLETEMNKIVLSFATIAEENVQLSHSLQSVGGMSAQDLASILTAGEKLHRLKSELQQTQDALERERVNQLDLTRASREAGILSARVEKYQQELAAVVTENSKLKREIETLLQHR